MLEIEPNVEGAGGRNVHPEPHGGKSFEDMVTLSFEMFLQSDLMHRHVSQQLT
jgi:hypothetical protein